MSRRSPVGTRVDSREVAKKPKQKGPNFDPNLIPRANRYDELRRKGLDEASALYQAWEEYPDIGQ